MISIHAPRAGRDPSDHGRHEPRHISIHAPRAGRDKGQERNEETASRISIHAPRAGRDDGRKCLAQLYLISIHAPRAGRDFKFPFNNGGKWISIHAPRAGRDLDRAEVRREPLVISIHAPRAGRDGRSCSRSPGTRRISIHAPRAGRDPPDDGLHRGGRISIHAPRAGRDLMGVLNRAPSVLFQSTRPVRGATWRRLWPRRRHGLFQSTRPVRGATTTACAKTTGLSYFNPRAPCGARLPASYCIASEEAFQSTRPVRGATLAALYKVGCLVISIHAPRAGRDAAWAAARTPRAYFNPRAPCGARRAETSPSTA